MEVKIKTLTPLWTGGVETGKVDRIHETGILGSLRWWMEVLVRGLGGNACDPTSDERSSFDFQKFDAKIYRQLQDEVKRRQYLRDTGLCDVSQIFGATGWKRRFRLEVQETQVSDANIKHPIEANRTYTNNQSQQKTPTWYFQSPPKSGSFTIQLQKLSPDFKPEVIGGLIQFIADWSALGARPQMGFGVIQVEGSRINTQSLYDWLVLTTGNITYPDLPSLRNIFLAKIQLKDSNTSFKEQDTFNLKYDLRQLFRTDTETDKRAEGDGKPRPKKKDEVKDLRHFIMGTVEDDRMAAKIKISRPYNDSDGKSIMRVWGWIPEKAVIHLKDNRKKDLYINGWDRAKIVSDICQHLKENYTLLDWREMNSVRDTVTENQTDVQAFLRSLLQLQEDD